MTTPRTANVLGPNPAWALIFKLKIFCFKKICRPMIFFDGFVGLDATSRRLLVLLAVLFVVASVFDILL